MLSQLAELYRDGTLIGQAIEQTTAQRDSERARLAERRTALANEIQQTERALEPLPPRVRGRQARRRALR